MKGTPPAATRIWRMPLMIAFVTIAGLVVALVDSAQPWRGIAWALLAAPLLVMALAYAGCWPPARADRRYETSRRADAPRARR